MKKSPTAFYVQALKNFGEATINIFIFLPYFFSVSALTRTLFYPWKNLASSKKLPGFSFNDWLNRAFFNFISRSIGFVMRVSIICFYLVFQGLFMLALPLIALIHFILVPVFYVNYLFSKEEGELKAELKDKFVKVHLTEEKNRSKVETWFEDYYRGHLTKSIWWKKQNLFEIPPLARDWATGYTPILDQYATDLATASYLHHIKNIVGRTKEISEMERALSATQEANVLIVGEEGVGKHTIVDALARKIYLGRTSVHLMYKRILKLNMEKVLSMYPDLVARESFLESLLEEAASAKNIILFIDSFEKYVDFAESFLEYGKDGQLQIIAITTPQHWEKTILPVASLSRLFEKIDVHEVDRDEAMKIVLEVAPVFEKYHKLIITYEALTEIIDKSDFYITYIPYPEKAVDLMDSACTLAKSKNISLVTPVVVGQALTEKTHTPTTITKTMKEKLVELETLLGRHIVQQSQAINKLAIALRRSFLLIGRRKKPLASFLFLGPTGVGKTETAKAVGQVFFQTEKFIRLDMSQFQSKSDISKLIGDEAMKIPGTLSTAVRENPYGVLLLDELEKADHDLLNIFLTVLDEGYFTDGYGRRVDCKSLVIIATSNAASDQLYQRSQVNIIDYLIENKIYSPEFLNRFDDVVVFEPLTKNSMEKIARKMIDRIAADMKSLYKVNLKVTEETLARLADKGFDPKFGARFMERTIRDELEDKISKNLLEGRLKESETLTL